MILVTGASQGIGFECARELLERTPSEVLVTGRSAERLRRAREALPLPCRARLATRVCDQGDASALEALLVELADGRSALEGAILAVGVNPVHGEGPRKLHALDAATIEATIRVNCTHTLRLAACVLDRLWRRRAGALILIGSQAARVGMPGAALYCATKSFLSGLARAADREYGTRGVRIHLLHPGLVRTPRTAAMAEGFAGAHEVAVAEAADIARRIVDVYLAATWAPVEMDL